MRLFVTTPKTNFHRPRHVRRAFLLLIVFLLSGIPVVNQPAAFEEESNVEWIRFDLPEDSIRNLVGELDESLSLEQRPLLAHSRLGVQECYSNTRFPTSY